MEKQNEKPVQIKKRSELQKFLDRFLADDISNIRKDIVNNVIIPAVKRIATEAVNAAFYKTGEYSDDSRGDRKEGYRNYSRSSGKTAERTYREPSDVFGVDNLLFRTRAGAENVLNELEERIREYGMVTVAYLYSDILDEECPYTYNDYGWTSMRGARISMERDGWLLRLPRTMPID